MDEELLKPESDSGPEPVLKVEELSVGFETDEGVIAITDKVDFEIRPGEIFGLVGESGCGKTVTCLSILKLLPAPRGRIISGRIFFKGRDLLEMNQEEIRKVRGKEISMIFQEPAAALNPLMKIEAQMMECFEYHEYEGDHQGARIRELLERVGIADPQRVLNFYPHELSGGMLQRVMISMALLLEPDLLIADEPTTALDVTVQAQIMELLEELQREKGTAILMITHNMGLIAQYAHRLGVMYAGRLVEESEIEAFVKSPLHPYSRGLVGAIPDLNAENPELKPISGQVPQPSEFPAGCRFKERCPQAFELCASRPPLSWENENQKVACFLY